MSGSSPKAPLERSPIADGVPPPSPCSHLLPHDQAHMRISLYLFFKLILDAMRCTGASRHTHDCRASTTNVRTGQEHGVRRKRETGAGKLATYHRARCQTRSCVAQSPSIEDRHWRGSGDDDGRKERETKRRQATVKRHHGGMGPLEELWHPGQLAKDVAGKSLVGGMLLERVGSAALLYMPVASTPCMDALLCAPSGEVGRRGNLCLLCVSFFLLLAGRRRLDGTPPSQ